jgi:hypothetical protein
MKASQKFCLLCLVSLLLLLCGCGSPGAPLPPSLELPRPVADLQAVRKGDRVYLTWTIPSETTDHQTIRHPGPSRICRSLEAMTACTTVVGEVPPASPTTRTERPRQAAYVDSLPHDVTLNHPTSQLNYGVSVLNASGRSAGLSNLAQVPAAPALPPPGNSSGQVTPDGPVLSWTPVAALPLDDLRYLYRIYRREEGATTDTVVDELPLGAPSTQTTDRNFEWEKTYSYRATVVTFVPRPGKSDLQVEGEDTPAVKLFLHDVFPPAVPRGLQAVASGVGQPLFIDLIWSPVADADLAGYNVYRHEQGSTPAKINPELVKTPAYRDANLAPGHTYFYSVSAVDLRGNESAPSAETSETLPESGN